MGTGSMDAMSTDPFFWSIDEVVHYLCQDSFSDWARSSLPRPDPVALESHLRENSITGEVLLTDVDREVLLHFLGLKSFGHISTISKAIQHLKSRSFELNKDSSQPTQQPTQQPLISTSPKNDISPLARISPTQGPRDLTPASPSITSSKPNKRRRLDPTSISTQPLKDASETHSQQARYLCSEKQPFMDIFYHGPGSDDDDTFGYVRPPNFPRGQSLFVNKRMQHYLKQAPQLVKDDKEASITSLPHSYSHDRSAVRLSPGYFTSSKKNDQGFGATVEEVKKWPHLQETDPLDYLLTKYPSREHEVPLPLYGDSGSEDYDSDTCREMDEAKDDAMGKEATLLSAATVGTIIDNFITETINKWNQEKRPAQEDWRLWKRSRRQGTIASDINRAKVEINRLDSRLAKWSKAIMSNEYEKGDQVIQQCGSLEVTITQRELQKWKISVLEMPSCPPHTEICRPKMRRPRLQDNDEESIGSDTDDAIDADSGFVVPDTTPIALSDESLTVLPKQTTLASNSGPFEDIDFVDLTQNELEEPQETILPNPESPDSFQIHTPPLNPVDMPKMPVLNSPASRETSISDLASAEDLPKISDVVAISKMTWVFLQTRRDRKRFLAKLVYLLPVEERVKHLTLITSIEKLTWRRRVRDAIRYISKNQKEAIPDASQEDSWLFKRMATLYVSWQQIKQIMAEGIPKKFLRQARQRDDLNPFYDDLTEILHVEYPSILEKGRDKASKQAEDLIIIDDDDDDNSSEAGQEGVSATPRKKRKRAVPESREAMETQNRAQRRVEEQATRQRLLLEEQVAGENDPHRKIVSFDDPVIYLHRDLGRHVKEHQVSGIQFMWRELIKDEKQQGCLLAHTMGLGKTMQVISLLITIACASNSPDPLIKAQIPERFRLSRTLITCPSCLIENWWEEFEKWTPSDLETRHYLGEVRKVTPLLNIMQRVLEINSWYTNGGVLLISHELFRRMITDKREMMLPKESEMVKRQLLEGPNIIVADEAHKLKNSASDLSKVCSMFQSKSRIALTGSPLSNQLLDYYQMINWISPGYLGNLKQFKAKYEEPIREGLYFDSTQGEYVRSRKKLEVLKKVLEPKVHRADISVIESDLRSKVEFVIVIPVTPLQEETYNQFVTMTMQGLGDFGFTRLWALLSYLILVCHHPFCFLKKLRDKKETATKTPANSAVARIDPELMTRIDPELMTRIDPELMTPTELEDEAIDTVSRMSINSQLVLHFEQKFKDIKDLESPIHSRRTQMVGQIVDESIKAGDKVLIFSGHLHTLDYLGNMLKAKGQKHCRLDGKTPVASRQVDTKAFGTSESNAHVYLISTKAGALGLNIIGANRVIIFESEYNPTWEEQAIGRAYRLGQKKEVFVYRFVMGGTFEELIHEKGVFKKNMALRAVDDKNPTRSTGKSTSEFRRLIRKVERHDLSEFYGKDPKVLDKILAQPNDIYKITLTETLHREDAGGIQLTAEDQSEIQAELADEKLERSDPERWAQIQIQKRLEERIRAIYPPRVPSQPLSYSINTPPATLASPGTIVTTTPKPPTSIGVSTLTRPTASISPTTSTATLAATSMAASKAVSLATTSTCAQKTQELPTGATLSTTPTASIASTPVSTVTSKFTPVTSSSPVRSTQAAQTYPASAINSAPQTAPMTHTTSFAPSLPSIINEPMAKKAQEPPTPSLPKPSTLPPSSPSRQPPSLTSDFTPNRSLPSAPASPSEQAPASQPAPAPPPSSTSASPHRRKSIIVRAPSLPQNTPSPDPQEAGSKPEPIQGPPPLSPLALQTTNVLQTSVPNQSNRTSDPPESGEQSYDGCRPQ